MAFWYVKTTNTIFKNTKPILVPKIGDIQANELLNKAQKRTKSTFKQSNLVIIQVINKIVILGATVAWEISYFSYDQLSKVLFHTVYI